MTSLPPVPLSPPVGIEDCNKNFQASSFAAKNVLITGGASGVGAAIAQTFAEKGAYVTIVDIAKELGTQVADNIHARGHHAQYMHADITSWPSILSAFKTAATFHPSHTLTTVIACAGVLGTPFILPTERPLALVSSPSASTMSAADPPAPDVSAITINAIGLTYTCKLAQLFFEAAAPGPSPPPKSLLLFTSMLAYTDFHNSATYTASKHAARGLFRILRPLLSARGHRVNAVAPWLTRTPMTDGTSGGGAPDLVGLFEAVGCPVAEGPEWCVRASLVVEERALNGRVLAAGPDRVFDMRDDAEGRDGAEGLQYFGREVVPGWSEYYEKIRLIVEGKVVGG